MNTSYQKIYLITYGLGDHFDPKLFRPVQNNNFVKPNGGLWASPIKSKWGWKNWCKSEKFGNLSSYFKFYYQGNILKIDSLQDALKMPWVDICQYIAYPDFEKLAQMGIDAIWLTLRGEIETRYSNPGLYGWDCESVLVINPAGIIEKKRG